MRNILQHSQDLPSEVVFFIDLALSFFNSTSITQSTILTFSKSKYFPTITFIDLLID